MVTANHLERFLAAAAKMFPESKSSTEGGAPFVTISRQAGAGGHVVARALLDRTFEARPKALFEGWSLFDERLAEMVAENPALKVSLKGLAEEDLCRVFKTWCRRGSRGCRLNRRWWPICSK